MPETSPRPDVPSSTLPAPQPTHPVARRTVSEQKPEFRWTPVPDASGYRLQLAGSASFDDCFYDEPVDGPTRLSLEAIVPDGVETVVWRVRGASTEAPWSEPATFTLTEHEPETAEQFLVDAPPVPIRPVRGDALDNEAATLTWEGIPEASGYRVQIASSPEFGDPGIELTLDQTTTLTLFDELPPEQQSLYWRVRALFPNDTEGPWSEPNHFGTDPGGEVDVAAEGEVPADETVEDSEEIPPERSPRASGPAREAHTGSTEVLVGISVFLVSFLLTILLVMLV